MGKTYALRRFMKNWQNRGGSKMERNGLLSLQAMMFLLIGAGVFLKKKNIITGEGRKVLTDLKNRTGLTKVPPGPGEPPQKAGQEFHRQKTQKAERNKKTV